MARKMEKRSARLLALILALIMIGSVFAYMMRGGYSEKREVKYHLENFREYVNWVPDGVYYFQYFNFTYLSQLDRDDPMVEYVNTNLKDVLISAVFSRTVLEVTSGIHEILVANYMKAVPLYLVNAGGGKVYFAKEDEIKHGEFTLQVRRGAIAFVGEVSPFLIGYKPLVENATDIISGKDNLVGAGNFTYKYLSRINGSFAYALFMYGDAAKSSMKAGNESVGDFFFEGYRYNFANNTYEKVWAIHFLGHFFFGGMNESEKDFQYYKVKNFEDNFGIAVMEDANFTKVLKARPNILSWSISFNTTT